MNAVIKTYPDISQFWTYNATAFLKEPVYSRNWPPVCPVVWGGDPVPPAPPADLLRPLRVGGLIFPAHRLAVLAVALLVMALLYLLLDRTRLGAMIRAGVDDREMARGVGIRVSLLFTAVFFLGEALAGFGGASGGPILSAYPGWMRTCYRWR